jgi:hypothetical protein
MNDKPKMNRTEISRLGGLALAKDPEKKRASILKGLATKRRKKLTGQLGTVTAEQSVNEWKKLIIDEKK